jgi:hypothetical protein
MAGDGSEQYIYGWFVAINGRLITHALTEKLLPCPDKLHVHAAWRNQCAPFTYGISVFCFFHFNCTYRIESFGKQFGKMFGMC